MTGHSCHLRIHHAGAHFANLCGMGHKGGRKARWRTVDDLTITGKGTGEPCGRCTRDRRKSDHPRVRVVLVSP